MIRIGLVLAFLAVSATAAAQPVPSVTLDIDLTPVDGFGLNGYAPPGRLAVDGAGTHYIVLHEYKPAGDPFQPAAAARISLAALGADGAVKFKTVLPVRRLIGPNGFTVESMGVVPGKSGDIAVFISGGNPPVPPLSGPSAAGTLFRLAPGGQLKKEAAVGPPRPPSTDPNAPPSYYELETYLPTPDNALLLAGGFGSGPYAWWLGKLSLDGARLWQAGPGRGFPERVGAVAVRPDGTTIALVQEMRPGDVGPLDWYIHRYAADGSAVARMRLPERYGFAVTVLRNGCLFVLVDDAPRPRASLVHLDDVGHVIRRSPWPFGWTRRMIPDGDGFVAIVAQSYDADAPEFVVRADAKGVIRWRSPAVDVSDIALAPGGQVAALVWSEKRGTLRLRNYANP
jgi:hypothetical protein